MNEQEARGLQGKLLKLLFERRGEWVSLEEISLVLYGSHETDDENAIRCLISRLNNRGRYVDSRITQSRRKIILREYRMYAPLEVDREG